MVHCRIPFCWDMITEPALKGVSWGPSDTKFIASRKFHSGQASFSVLEENFFTLFSTYLVLPKYSPFYETLEEKTHQLRSSGIIQRKLKTSVNPRGFSLSSTSVVNDIGPQVLTLEHLEISFLICFLPLALGVAAFFCEHAIFRMKKYFIKKK